MSEIAPDTFSDEAFARRLRQARLALGLTEEEAARTAGRTVKVWRNYEATGRGRIDAPIRHFVRTYWRQMAKQRINLDWFLAGEGTPPPTLRLIRSVQAEPAAAAQPEAPRRPTLRLVHSR